MENNNNNNLRQEIARLENRRAELKLVPLNSLSDAEKGERAAELTKIRTAICRKKEAARQTTEEEAQRRAEAAAARKALREQERKKERTMRNNSNNNNGEDEPQQLIPVQRNNLQPFGGGNMYNRYPPGRPRAGMLQPANRYDRPGAGILQPAVNYDAAAMAAFASHLPPGTPIIFGGTHTNVVGSIYQNQGDVSISDPTNQANFIQLAEHFVSGMENLFFRLTNQGQEGHEQTPEQRQHTQERVSQMLRNMTAAAPTAAGGAPPESSTQASDMLQKILEAVEKQPDKIAALLEKDEGPMQSAFKRAMSDRDATGPSDPLDAFVASTAADEPLDTPTKSASEEKKEEMFRQEMSTKKPSVIASSILPVQEGVNGNEQVSTRNAFAEFLENAILFAQDVTCGDIRLPVAKKFLLEEVLQTRGQMSPWKAIGRDLHIHKECFVSVGDSDEKGCGLKDSDQVTGELMKLQRSPCMVGQSLEIQHELEGGLSDTIIEFNSVYIQDSAPALNLVFQHVCTDTSVVKVIVNAPRDKMCTLSPGTLKGAACPIHFNGAALNHHQARALSSATVPIVFDNSPIDGLEQHLFSGNRLKIGIVADCSSSTLQSLAQAVQDSKISALYMKGISFHVSNRDEANRVLELLGQLSTAALAPIGSGITCDLAFCNIDIGNEPLGNKLSSCVDIEGEFGSVDILPKLGTKERLEALGKEAREKDDTSGTIDDAAPTLKTVFETSGKLIQQVGTHCLRFTGYDEEPFELDIGQSITIKRCSITILHSGELQYSFHIPNREPITFKALVPLGASRNKWWCLNCTKPSAFQACVKHAATTH